MIITDGNQKAIINTISNWPLTADLFVKWGYSDALLEKAKETDSIKLKVSNIENIVFELSAWGIPIKRI